MKVSLSEMDRRVEFISVTGTRDSFGVFQTSEEVALTMRCKLIKTAMKNPNSDGVEVVLYKPTIILKYNKNIVDSMSCIVDGIRYDITGIEKDFRNRTMKILIESKKG